MITFRHRDFLRNNFTRLFAEKVVDRRIYKSLPMIAKPDVRASINPVLSQIKQATGKKVEEIIKSKLTADCEKCGPTMVGVRG